MHNWACGKHDIPYATYRLLRLLNHMELPGQSWRGWSFSRGLLISPEGHTLRGNDGAWWSLLVRRAALSSALAGQIRVLKQRLESAGAGEGAPLAGGVAPAPADSARRLVFSISPLVITGRSIGVPAYGIRSGAFYAG
ncbi:DUF3653 domain-containing protein [Delftia acidovorans]|uniref:DUF3653 domain-containing protein n=1 Tax=Delftia acidovorans TaxID=80866 RepID=UPI003C6D3183